MSRVTPSGLYSYSTADPTGDGDLFSLLDELADVSFGAEPVSQLVFICHSSIEQDARHKAILFWGWSALKIVNGLQTRQSWHLLVVHLIPSDYPEHGPY
jgi:hypothetical protein